MCGIFGIVGKDAPSKVFNGLLDIEYRGYDSWGIASWKIDDGSWKIDKEIGFLPSSLNLPPSNIAIGHTRWATHGGVTELNAHPHTDCTGKLVIVHNGIVENYLELKKTLKNHKFKSETDTEIIIHLIEDEYRKTKDLTKAASSVFKQLGGLNAIVVSDGKEIVACKVGSPLVAGVNGSEFLVASDPNALLPHTKKLLFLEDGQMVVLNQGVKLYHLQGDTSKIKPKFTEVDWTHTTASLNKFPHFMIKEIYEQPEVLSKLTNDLTEIRKTADLIKKAFGTYFIGCGTAAYACLVGVYLFSKIAKKHVNFSAGSEFNYIQDYLTPKSLLIAVSQSGESIDVIEPVVGAKKIKTKIIAMTNVLGSTLYRMADFRILLKAGMEKGVLGTKSYTSMVANLILLSFSLVKKEKKGVKIVKQSARIVKKVLERSDQIKILANKIYQAKHIYVLGRGLSYPVALESALKIKESSYIHAEGFAAGELKHGVIALIEKHTPVLVFVPNDETKEAILSNAMEVKSRGAFVIGVGAENSPVFDYYFQVGDDGVSSVIPHVVFSQLLAYYLTLKLGHNPDKPRNLAKSVVVR